jgi:hypothetical protein
MRPYGDTTYLPGEERLSEIVSILATAVLRLRSRAALSADSRPDSPSENLRDSTQDCLDAPEETVLSVHCG